MALDVPVASKPKGLAAGRLGQAHDRRDGSADAIAALRLEVQTLRKRAEAAEDTVAERDRQLEARRHDEAANSKRAKQREPQREMGAFGRVQATLETQKMHLEQRASAAETAVVERDRQLEELRRKLDEASKRPKQKNRGAKENVRACTGEGSCCYV